MKTHPFHDSTFTSRRENPGRGEFRSSPLPAPPSRGGSGEGGTCRISSWTLRIWAVLLIVSVLGAETAFADEALLRGPRKVARQQTEAAAPKAGILEAIAAAPVLFYQRFLGPSWGRQCQYYPSCSNYALLAIAKHGAVVGSIMAFDRLQHEANEVGYSPLIVTGGGLRTYDPLENNDYWWYTTGRSESAAPRGAGREAKP